MSNFTNHLAFVLSIALNQSMTSYAFLHCISSDLLLTSLMILSKMDLLIFAMLDFAGLSSLHLTFPGKPSLWSFIEIKAGCVENFGILLVLFAFPTMFDASLLMASKVSSGAFL